MRRILLRAFWGFLTLLILAFLGVTLAAWTWTLLNPQSARGLFPPLPLAALLSLFLPRTIARFQAAGR